MVRTTTRTMQPYAREAARIMIESYGEAVRRLRQSRRLSQRALAADPRVWADHSRISRIETGEDLGSEGLAAELDTALGADGALVAAYARDAQARREGGDPMRRRTMLQALTAMSLGAGGSAEAREALRHGLGLALGHDRGAEEWAEIAADYARDFYLVPSGQLVDDVTADLAVLGQMLDVETRARVRADLSLVSAQLSVIMAMGLAGLGQMRHARRWWRTARDSADAVGDAPVRMWVRDWEAVDGLYEGRGPRVVVGLAEAGLAIAPTVCAGRAGLLAALAQGRAVDGDEAGALAALVELEAVTAAMPAAVRADADSMHGWPDVRLHYTASYVHTHLRRTADAYAAQDAALAAYPVELARERAQMQMHRAACLVVDGDVAGGVEYAHTALDDLPRELHNALLFQLARGVVDAVPGAGRDRPDVAELAHRTAAGAALALGSR